MSDLDSRCLDEFPAWLRSLADDAMVLVAVVADAAVPEDARRHVVAALSYLLKSLDLIPDGIEELGYLDDAFVIRVAARLAGHVEPIPSLERLARDAELVSDFLAVDYPRLERYVAGLGKLTVRGRSVDDVLASAEVAESFSGEVRGWSRDYVVPAFGRDAKNLVKLRSFLKAKLPG